MDPTTAEAAIADAFQQISKALSQYTARLMTETDTAVDQVRSLDGIPAVDQGANVKQFVLDQFGQSRDAISAQQAAVGNVQTGGDPQAAGAQLDAIVRSLKSATVTAPALVSGIASQFPAAGLSDAFANTKCPA